MIGIIAFVIILGFIIGFIWLIIWVFSDGKKDNTMYISGTFTITPVDKETENKIEERQQSDKGNNTQ